jgi:hypothetical protein
MPLLNGGDAGHAPNTSIPDTTVPDVLALPINIHVFPVLSLAIPVLRPITNSAAVLLVDGPNRGGVVVSAPAPILL